MNILLSIAVIMMVGFEGWRMWYNWKTKRDEEAHREWIRQQVIEDASKALTFLAQSDSLDNANFFRALEDMAYHAYLGNLQVLFNHYTLNSTTQFRLDLTALVSSLLVVFKGDQTIGKMVAAIAALVESKIPQQ